MTETQTEPMLKEMCNCTLYYHYLCAKVIKAKQVLKEGVKEQIRPLPDKSMVEFCEGTLDTMMERLCNSVSSMGKEWIKRCIPATEEQIQKLQDIFTEYHYTIPSAYLQYLKVMGRNDRGFLGDNAYDPNIDTILELLTKDDGVRKAFEKGFFIFSNLEVYSNGLYLKLSPINDNPIVINANNDYVAGSFEKLLFQRVFEMYQETQCFAYYATSGYIKVCQEKKKLEKCNKCLYGMTADEGMEFISQFVESYGVKKTWFSDQRHLYYYDRNYILAVEIERDGYSFRFWYNDNRLFELVEREFEKIGIYIFNQDKPEKTPRLPDTGRKPEDFVPEGWKIVDHVELDYNADGMMDYVGVLEIDSIECRDYPQILFAITNNGTGEYHLDFQNIDLIQNEYLPLTAQGTSFTMHLHHSNWQSWEDTFTYREGVWWLTSSELTSNYPLIYYYKKDWITGVGIWKWGKISAYFDEAEKVDKTDYDVIYELALDDPLTLEQAGKREAAYCVEDWKVESITFAAGVELPENRVDYPDEGDIDYCDEDYVLYTFSDRNEDFDYLALYRWQDKVLSVLAKEESYSGGGIKHSELYKGKIYYPVGIKGNVTYSQEWLDEKNPIVQEEGTIGFMLNRINLDGTEKETIFEYRYHKAEQEIIERGFDYDTVECSYEISGGEIVIEIYLESTYPTLFYRMKTDGSGLRKIEPVSTEL